MKKIGIITFHNSYNCGSMLESYAMMELFRQQSKAEIIDFSSDGQKELYAVFSKNNSIKNIVKNIIIFPFRKRIKNNNSKYEQFKKNFTLSIRYGGGDKIDSNEYQCVIAGSDQIWNITIKDADDAYFLNWAKKCRKIAYAPSFGAMRIEENCDNPEKYKKYLLDFDALSVREKNGQKWIKNLTDRDAELLIDPTLLFDSDKYDTILDDSNTPKGKYIFYYCPSFNPGICKLVKHISKKYELPVICWSAKSYATKCVWRYGFRLPKYESPSVYLSLIKNAELVITTSFHGTIFSTIYRKKFFTIKNGGMFGNDDRVKTLVEQLGIEERLIPMEFDDDFNYMESVNYSQYEKRLPELRKKAKTFIKKEIITPYETAK